MPTRQEQRLLAGAPSLMIAAVARVTVDDLRAWENGQELDAEKASRLELVYSRLRAPKEKA